MKPVSLLLISHSYPPVLGGSEIEAQRVCSALIRRGHRVTVLCAGGPPMPDADSFVDPAGVPVRLFGRGGDGWKKNYVYALGVAGTLWKERRNYELAYFLMQGAHLFTGLPVARWLGKAIVMKISGSSIITLMRNSWMGRAELGFLRKWAYRVMILNPGMAQEAVSAGFEEKRLLWMPNPVDTEEFVPCTAEERAELRARLGIPAAARAVIFVGRLAPEKELPSLVAAFEKVVREMPDALLLLVGDGPARKELEARALKLGANVRFVGRKPVEEVRQWLQASDAFALVSSNEGFPCSLVEAMSAGLASVVSDIPANLQLVDAGVHGLHAKVGDDGGIAEALLAVLADDARRAAMGAAGRARVLEHYSTEKVVERYERLFAEALIR